MIQIQPARIGNGKAIHAGIINGGNAMTLCTRNFYCIERGTPAPCEGEINCKKCLKALLAQIEEVHAEALEVDAELTRSLSALSDMMERLHGEAIAEDFERLHVTHWLASESGAWQGKDGESYVCDLPVKRGGFEHDGPCFDRVAGVQRHALTLSRKQRKAARRAQRATLRRQAPQMRAAVQARRTRRGTARATAKTLLVAAGVPQDVAQRYASAFSRGTEARTASDRIRLGRRNSKRVEVKRYTWTQFAERLSKYRPNDHCAYVHFSQAAARVRKMVLA